MCKREQPPSRPRSKLSVGISSSPPPRRTRIGLRGSDVEAVRDALSWRAGDGAARRHADRDCRPCDGLVVAGRSADRQGRPRTAATARLHSRGDRGDRAAHQPVCGWCGSSSNCTAGPWNCEVPPELWQRVHRHLAGHRDRADTDSWPVRSRSSRINIVSATFLKSCLRIKQPSNEVSNPSSGHDHFKTRVAKIQVMTLASESAQACCGSSIRTAAPCVLTLDANRSPCLFDQLLRDHESQASPGGWQIQVQQDRIKGARLERRDRRGQRVATVTSSSAECVSSDSRRNRTNNGSSSTTSTRNEEAHSRADAALDTADTCERGIFSEADGGSSPWLTT